MRPLLSLAALLLAATAGSAAEVSSARPALASPSTSAPTTTHTALQQPVTPTASASAAALMAAAASETAAVDPRGSTKAFHISLNDATAALDKVEAGATAVLEAKKANLDAMEAAVRRHFDSKRRVAEQLFGDTTLSAGGKMVAGGVRGGGLVKSGATSAEGEGMKHLTSEEALAAAVHEAAANLKGVIGGVN